MTDRRLNSMIYAVLPLVIFLACAGPAGTKAGGASLSDESQVLSSGERPPSPVVKSADVLKVFEPKPDGRDIRVSYDYTDLILGSVVLRSGPSERISYSRPSPSVGTRVVLRDRSRVRREGNKVVFSKFNAATKDAVFKCLQSLISLGDRIDIPGLPRNEQLAYWFNLHNMLVIATLTKHYPVTEPRKLEVNGALLHEAPMVKLKGVSLSLNDIRVGIVYRYWRDPRVMYGFFRGDLASPNIRGEAWKGDTVSAALNDNAREFVNALRGVRRRGRADLVVSPVYDEGRDRYFAGWPDDLRAHLREFAGKDVKVTIDRATDVVYGRYERRTADLTGGAYVTPKSQSLAGRITASTALTGNVIELWGPAAIPAIEVAKAGLRQKNVQLRLRQLRERVEIEDAPFDDQAQEVVE